MPKIELLEQQLIQIDNKDPKHTVEILNKLIADDFQEFSKSGKIYNKQDVLAALSAKTKRDIVAKNFITKQLAPDIFLITYITIENQEESLRSSIWKKIDNTWQIIFHQGTKK